MPIDVDAYYEKHARPVSRYDGQLEPEFQAALAAHYGWHTQEECAFSHTLDLPDGKVLKGAWDLRGAEAAMLGGCRIEGKRVLEYGPASGWLTSWIAARAGSMVALESPMGDEQNVVPTFGLLTEAAEHDVRGIMEKFRRSWWFTKREAGFDAPIVYADLHAPPSDLGRFDVSVMSTVLLRLPNPYLAIQGAAAITDEAIVVTEPVTKAVAPGDETSPLALFAPSIPPNEVNHWWHHSPAAICRMLMTVGFSNIEVGVNARPGTGPTLPLFTVTARRGAPASV